MEKAHAISLRNFFERCLKAKIGTRCINRVGIQNEQGLNLARVHIVDQTTQGF